ncbi:MAG: alpha/beta hydrolase [Planctomycetota bacterium]|nr:alpha/beta hydrolase [Planctomycetota bacterium]
MNKSQSHTFSHKSANLYVELEGNGPTVLILHGGFGHMGTMQGLRDLLKDSYQVITMDSRGMGRSSIGNQGISYKQQEDDALFILGELGIESYSLIGFSDGGITGLRMASHDKRVKALVTISSRWRAEDSKHLWELFPTVTRAVLSAGPQAHLLDDYDKLSPDKDFDKLGLLYSDMWKDSSPNGHPVSSVKEIGCPVLITAGDSDPIVPVQAAVDLHGVLRTSELLVLPKAGHDAHSERADLFRPALLRFLKDCHEA